MDPTFSSLPALHAATGFCVDYFNGTFFGGLESDVMYVDRRCVLYLFILQRCVDRISVRTMCITQNFYGTIRTV